MPVPPRSQPRLDEVGSRGRGARRARRRSATSAAPRRGRARARCAAARARSRRAGRAPRRRAAAGRSPRPPARAARGSRSGAPASSRRRARSGCGASAPGPPPCVSITVPSPKIACRTRAPRREPAAGLDLVLGLPDRVVEHAVAARRRRRGIDAVDELGAGSRTGSATARRSVRDAVAAPLERPAEREPLHRARHADVAEAALLLDGALVARRDRVREDALLDARRRTTTGNSRPFAECAVISETRSRRASTPSRSVTSATWSRNCSSGLRPVCSPVGSALSKSSAPAASSRRFSTRAAASGVPSASSARR